LREKKVHGFFLGPLEYQNKLQFSKNIKKHHTARRVAKKRYNFARIQLFKKGGQSLNNIGYSTERNVVSEGGGQEGVAHRKFLKRNKH